MSTHSYEVICKEIHDSWGESNLLIQALTSLSQTECSQIREKYREMFGEDLFVGLKNTSLQTNSNVPKISPETCVGLSMLMLNPHERDAIAVRQALDQQNGIKYKALMEVFVGRKSSHFLLIQQAYMKRYKRHLDQDIISIEPSHPFQMILMALGASHKSHNAEVSTHIAKCDAQRLYQTRHGRLGALDEAVVLEILSKRSIPQFKLAMSCYKHIYGYDYIKSLYNENYGGFEDALREVVEYIHNPPNYYAKTLYASIQSKSVDKEALARVMISRLKADMDEIQCAFKHKYGMNLKDAISASCLSGDYKEFLVALASAKYTSC